MIVRVWQGKLALWKTFWLFGAGGGSLVALAPVVVLLGKTGFIGLYGVEYVLLAIGLLHYYLVWAFVGTWRAATIYQGNPVWAVLARLAVAAETLIVPLLVTAAIKIILRQSTGGM